MLCYSAPHTMCPVITNRCFLWELLRCQERVREKGTAHMEHDGCYKRCQLQRRAAGGLVRVGGHNMGERWPFGENGVLSYDTRMHVSVIPNFIWPTCFPNAQNCQHISDGSHRMLHHSFQRSLDCIFKRPNINKIHPDCQRWLIQIKNALVYKLRN